MSNKPITAGDLVYVAIPCPACGSTESLGEIFKVERVLIASVRCERTGQALGPEPIAIGHPDGALLVCEVRRIDPIPPEQLIDTPREVTA